MALEVAADAPCAPHSGSGAGIHNGKVASYSIPACSMDLGNPFASFLDRRPKGSTSHEPSQSQSGWRFPHPTAANETVLDIHDASGRDATVDPFAHFLSLRPKPEAKPEPIEQGLREDVLRVKRHLLEVTVQAELFAQSRSDASDATSSRHVKQAQRYLEHPEQAFDAMSDSASNACDGDELRTMRSERLSVAGAQKPAVTAARTSKSSTDISFLPARSSIPKSASTPALSNSACRRGPPTIITGSPDASPIGHSSGTLLPPIGGATPMNSSLFSTPSRRQEDSLLKSWFAKTRTWNSNISEGNIVARRKDASLPGGAVVLGDGRIPLFAGRHLLSPGYFYSFAIEAVDDARDLAFGFGVSRLAPWHRACERPNYAYEVPGTVLIGYGKHVIDGGKWWNTDWDPRELEKGDIVGVLISPDGDITVFVNAKQVLRVKTTLSEDMTKFPGSPKSPKTPKTPTSPSAGARRQLYPIVDLHGRVSSVRLSANGAPPNVVLTHRNKLK